ncbi:hypothetical protein EJ06DRAFT_195055 [Trichodelitschia bisporula]|uniref:non-specific serine/threonine protein kinase n=1 Tax=Trichodelitschia bisporula TaxID=703511 RepID=A0A6G1I8B6_9PEZI|nr:hypothetical protein EJ06DRAFT_195055 [Trichodelitschia bisporula]
MGHREEHLEDFQPNPTAINYSSSDHQHMLPAPVSNALSSVQSELMHSKSEYSVAGNEQLYSRHSFFDLTPSEMSYDPYRDAHEAKPNYLEVAIKRSLSKDGRRVKPGHRSTLTRLEATRLEAARQSSRKSSRSYFTGTNSMRSSRAGRASHVSSRMSLTSSQAAGASHALVIRRQLSHRKRNVNFSHLRRGVTPDDATPAPTPSSGTSAIPGPNKVMPSHPRAIPAHSHRVDSPTPPHAPTGGAVRSLKEKLKGTTSAHRPTKPREFDSDARQASAEFGKVCEEAFFQSSFGSTATSNITEQRTARTDTPPSSLLRDSVNLSTGDLSSRVDKVVLRNRPLPPTPDYPRIQVTGEKGGTADGRRSVSAPQDRSYHKTVPDQDMNHLHIIPEEGRFADDENNTDYYNSPVYQRSPYRSVTDPQPYSQVYRPEATIRCVGASTPSPAGSFGAPSPLAIRKQKSNIGQERSPTPSADKPHPVSMVSDASDWQDCNSSGPSSAVDLTHPDGTRKGYPNHTFELSSVQRQRSVRKGAQARGGEAKKGFMNLFKRKKRTDAVISEVPSSPPSMVPSNSQVFVKPKDNTHWNALQRWLRIRPFTASTIIVSSRVNALNTVRMFLDEIRGPLGIQGISAEGWTVCANVPEDNEASAKPASFAIEIFEMQRNYRPIGVQLIRITQIRGAQSTVKIVVSKLGAFLRKFNLILDDKAEASRLIAAFNAPLEAVQEKLNQA